MNTTNQTEVAQMVLANMDAIEQGVRRAAGPARLGKDVIADLISDATLALLDTRGAAFDAERGSALIFCRMVAYQVATDRVRAMNRGGQFSGAYAGFGNATLDMQASGEDDQQAARKAKARNTHRDIEGACDAPDTRGNAVRVSGVALDSLANTTADDIADRDWLNKARAAVAEVLPMLTDAEQSLWAEMSAGTWDATEYAERENIAPATAHVRANRLRAKVAGLLAA